MGVFTGRSNGGPKLPFNAYPLNPSHSKEVVGNELSRDYCLAVFGSRKPLRGNGSRNEIARGPLVVQQKGV